MTISGDGERRAADAEPLNPGDEAQPGAPGTGENTCPACSGSGTLNAAPCPECGGTGIVIEGIGGG
jgi:RecJ-like exonuclease